MSVATFQATWPKRVAPRATRGRVAQEPPGDRAPLRAAIVLWVADPVAAGAPQVQGDRVLARVATTKTCTEHEVEHEHAGQPSTDTTRPRMGSIRPRQS